MPKTVGGEIPTAGGGIAVEVRGSGAGVFGEVLTTALTPLLRVYLSSAGDDRMWRQFLASGGSITVGSDSVATMATGTTIGAYSTLQTRSRIPYLPGEGVSVRFTAAFPTAGVASCFVVAGPYHGEDGVGVGYNGVDFAIMHRYGRKFEVQKLTLTAGASGAETATITLNGTGNSATLSSGTVQVNAREIAETGGFADSTVPYDAHAINDAVYFIRQASGNASGAMTYSSTGTSAGGLAAMQEGADGTQDWANQADWNIDPMDGSGPSGETLDPTKLNVWGVTYGWLGAAVPTFYLMSQDQPNRMIPIHRIQWTGAQSRPWCDDPLFNLTYAAASLGSTTDLSVTGASAAAFAQGPPGSEGDLPRFPAQSNAVVSLGSAALIPVLSIQCSPVDLALNRISRRRLLVRSISVQATGGKSLQVVVYRDIGPSNLTGYTFTSPSVNSPLLVDKASTAYSGTPAEVVSSTAVPAGTSVRIPFDPPLTIERGDVLAILAKGQASGSGSDVFVSVNGVEEP